MKFKVLLSCRTLAPRWGAIQVPRRKGDEKMKYLVTFDYDPADLHELAKKAKVYDENKKKTPDKFPDAIVPAHFMIKGCKGVAILEVSDPIQMANKFAFMLPESKYTFVPIIDARTFLKQYMEMKK